MFSDTNPPKKESDPLALAILGFFRESKFKIHLKDSKCEEPSDWEAEMLKADELAAFIRNTANMVMTEEASKNGKVITQKGFRGFNGSH